MPSPNVNLANGITITFGTSSFSAEILEVTPPPVSRDIVNTSHQGTTGAHNKMPKALYDVGELEFTVHFNPDTEPPIDAEPETITVTFGSGAKWEFSGFMTAYEPAGVFDDKMTATVRIAVDGAITITPPGT